MIEKAWAWFASLVRNLGSQAFSNLGDREGPCVFQPWFASLENAWALAGTLKPKYHYAHHIMDHIDRLGKVLSCFVLERKHRRFKQQAANVYGNYERCLICIDFNMQVEEMLRNPNMFSIAYLLHPRPDAELAMTLQGRFPGCASAMASRTAYLPCGEAPVAVISVLL